MWYVVRNCIVIKKILDRYKKTEESVDDSGVYIEKLKASIDNLTDASNANEKKIDDVFLKQTTIPNLVFSAAFFSKEFLLMLRSDTWFAVLYTFVVASFFVSVFFTLLSTTIEHVIIDGKLRKSNKLYNEAHKLIKDNDLYKDKIYNTIIHNNDSLLDCCLFSLLKFGERWSKVLNALSCVILVIYGVIKYV